MRRHFTNAIYGVLDYASYPFGMLLVGPLVLHKLGASEYGLWMIATSVISAGGIVASGFCDASIQRVARHRARGDTLVIVFAVRSTLGICLLLGCGDALIVWLAEPYAVLHIARSSTISVSECGACLRIASVLILVRGIESVAVSVHRAFEEYRDTVQISSAVRLCTLASAAILAVSEKRTVSILTMTAVFLVLGTLMQFRQLRQLLGSASFWPTSHPEKTRKLLGLGVFVWLQVLGSVVFGQFDRILLGLSFGAQAVAPYGLCVKFSQSAFGIAASGLHFLFPYLYGRTDVISIDALKQMVLKAFVCNLILVTYGAGLLLLVGGRLVQMWAGSAVAQSAARVFPLIVFSSVLMGLSVTCTYALQSLGPFRAVALISLGGRATMLVVMIYLFHHFGLKDRRQRASVTGRLRYWFMCRYYGDRA